MSAFSAVRGVWNDLPLASKIAGVATVLVILIVSLLTLLTIEREERNFRNDVETQARLMLDTLLPTLKDSLVSNQVDDIQDIHEDIKDQVAWFKVYSDEGRLLVPETLPDVDPRGLRFKSGPEEVQLDWDESPSALVAWRAVKINEVPYGAVELGFSTDDLDNKIRGLTTQSLALAGVLLMITILLAIVIARQITNPLTELSATASEMAGGDLKARFRRERQDEIGRLGRAFNDLASAIEKRETDLRELAAGLEKAVKERTIELQEQNEYLGALHEVTLGLIENLDVERLLEAIVTRAAALANTPHAFVTIVGPARGEMQIRVAQGAYRTRLGTSINSDRGLSGRVVASGQMMIEADYQEFEGRQPGLEWLRTSIYVPLRSESTVLGVIGLGYDQVVPINADHVAILDQFAQLASLALINAQRYGTTRQDLDEEIGERAATQEALRAEEARHLEYLTSPRGQAEFAATAILEDPSRALIELHNLAQKAEHGPDAAILPEMSKVLELMGHPMLARLAEGFHFVFRSNAERELLAVGLRHLRTGLDLPEARWLQEAHEARTLYGVCQQAIDASSVRDITEMLTPLRALSATEHRLSTIAGAGVALNALALVAESLLAYERVDTTSDRGDYLDSAVEHLSQAGRLAKELGAADRPIVQRICQNWLGVVQGALSDLQTRAQLACRLITRHPWREDVVTLALRLRNEGQAMARNVRVELAVSPDYAVLGEAAVTERLATGDETQVELRVRPCLSAEIDRFRGRFMIVYDDPRGPARVEHFTDIVHLLTPEGTFQFIPNPYVVGRPLHAGSPLFFGREDIFRFIDENLRAAYRNNLVLIGQRRTGKSSLLKQLPLRLGDKYVPVYLDGQSIAIDPGLPAFFLNLSTEIAVALQARGFLVAIPDPSGYAARPARTFERDFLRRVKSAIGDRHLLLLLDEFEELEAATQRGSLDPSIFGFLRHLIQHEAGLSVIFCGTHRIEELPNLSVLFNIGLYRPVGFLAYEEAVRLIQEPVAAYGMRYDELALDKMWRVTSGHPYFLQLICYSLVSQHNRAERSYVAVSDVNAALNEILASGEAHFVYLWNESSLEERQVLAALSWMMPLTGRATAAQVADYLAARGAKLGREAASRSLHHLALRDILAVQSDSNPIGGAETFRWQLGLLGLWVEKYRSLSRIRGEAHS